MCFYSVDSVKLGKNSRSTSRSRTNRLQILNLTSWYGSYFHRVMRRDSEVDVSSISPSSERSLTLVNLSDTNFSVSLRLRCGTGVSLENNRLYAWAYWLPISSSDSLPVSYRRHARQSSKAYKLELYDNWKQDEKNVSNDGFEDFFRIFEFLFKLVAGLA